MYSHYITKRRPLLFVLRCRAVPSQSPCDRAAQQAYVHRAYSSVLYYSNGDTMRITASKLRENIYQILDEAINTGTAVEVIRKGSVLRIVPVLRLFLGN